MSIVSWAIPLLGVLALLYTMPSLKNGVKMKHYLLIALAVLTLGFSWWNNWDNEDKTNALTAKSDSLITVNNSIKDSLLKLNKTIAELGLQFDEKTNKLLITDSQLLKRSILQIVNHNETFFNPIQNTQPPLTNIIDDQRHLTDSMIFKIKTIPKNYTVNIMYHPDKETANLVTELKHKLMSLGYKIGIIDTSMMGPYPKQFEFTVMIDDYKKTAEIDIAQQAFTIQ